MFHLRSFALALPVGLMLAASGSLAQGVTPEAVRHAVEAHVGKTTTAESNNVVLWEPGYPGGVVVAVQEGQQLFVMPYGCAVGTVTTWTGQCMVDAQTAGTPMTPTSVFNLASVGKLFTAVTLAHTTSMSTEDSPSKYITALTGACIQSKTLGEIASQSSGLRDYPSKCYSHKNPYGYQDFIDSLNCWGDSLDPSNPCPPPPPKPGHYIYSDQGFILLRLVLANHFTTPFSSVLQNFTQAVGMKQTAMIDKLNQLPNVAVQGYGCYVPPEAEEGVDSGCNGEPVPPSTEVSYGWYQDNDGNGSQVWSSAQDMGLLASLALDLPGGNFPLDWQQAMNTTEKIIFTGCRPKVQSCNPEFRVGMAWQKSVLNGTTILGKNGGVPFSSTYIGLVPDIQIAVVVLVNRGQVDAAGAGQQILEELAGMIGKAK
jgi:CubicO group peptidase (beta-lactamase class C family)